MSWLSERFACRLSLALALAFLGGGCDDAPHLPARRPVPPGAFATVGQRTLGLDLLTGPARATDVASASRSTISDALVALDSRAGRPERAEVIERGLLVRGLLDLLRTEALRRAPPQPDELDLAAKALWTELDRPRSVRTVNIMALVAPLADGEREERVMRLIAEQVRGAATTDELGVRVERVPRDGVDVKLIVVPPVTEDGRVYIQTAADATGPVPPLDYAQAAAQLTYVGETSGLVSTAAGYHVLMATDILPPVHVAEPERSRRLEQAVADRRIAPELERLKAELSARTTVWQSPHAAALTSLVWRTQPAQDPSAPAPPQP
jgi:hypothetical protein